MVNLLNEAFVAILLKEKALWRSLLKEAFVAISIK